MAKLLIIDEKDPNLPTKIPDEFFDADFEAENEWIDYLNV